MRLTKAIREEIEHAVMRDVPDHRKEDMEALKTKVKEFFEAEMPEPVRLAYKDHPDWIEDRSISIHVYPDGTTHWQENLDKMYGAVRIPYNLYDYDELLRKQDWFNQAVADLCAACTERAKARKEVQEALRSVTTAKRLKETYPDIAAYLPEDSAGKALAVPANLPNLKATGWPDETRKQNAQQDQAED